MNFATLTVSYGGRMGGGRLLIATEAEEFSLFSWKTHIFEATGGAIKVGRMEGRKNGGANGWANFGIHGRAMGGRLKHLWANLQPKK